MNIIDLGIIIFAVIGLLFIIAVIVIANKINKKTYDRVDE
jgi:hypothetical protein